jgi:endoglucanase
MKSYCLYQNFHRKISIYFVVLGCLFVFSSQSISQSFKINDLDYFETTGLNVLVFSREYDGFFFDEKTSGIELVHHGVRTATGGAIRLQNTPEQWDMIPKMLERKVNKETNSIEVVLRYEQYDFNTTIAVTPKGEGFTISVSLDTPVPEELVGNAGLNFEFLPSAYFEKSYMVDGKPGIFPLYPSGNTKVEPISKKIPQYAGLSTFDDRGHGEFLVPKPIAQGKMLVFAPEDPERHVRIQSETDLMLFDGRMLAQNGWFIVRSLLPTNKTGKVLEWFVQPNAISDWVREPVIGFSQVGYHPLQQKIAIIELDRNDVPKKEASLYQVTSNGKEAVHTAKVEVWGNYLRYNYVKFDFSSVKTPGIYYIQYGDFSSNTFVVDNKVHEKIWHPTLDVFFPVQMDHMTVNEAYRTWHGASFLDDALQAPVNVEHFDGYRMGPETDTKYKSLERIPGLNVGGWYDAGDFDIQTGTHSTTILSLVDSWEHFGIDRDQTYINQETRYVDIHRPDGKPDLLQQIEHGILNLVAQVENIGHPVRGIVVPNLHQYHHLGDGSTSTDNLPYNPNLKPYETDGLSSGTMDDRWVFTNRSPMLDFATSAALAASGRALTDFNGELSKKCLVLAEKLYNEAYEATQKSGYTTRSPWGRSSEINAALQLFISLKEPKYAKRFEELIFPALDNSMDRNISLAFQAYPHMGNSYKKKLRKYALVFKQQMDDLMSDNPYGIPLSTRRGWGGNQTVVSLAIANYYAYEAFPEVFDPENVFRGLNYLLGCHPYSNLSFVSAVGTRSKKVAYGNNRADFSFIAGGVVPGLVFLAPDILENKEDWPFFWGENEYIIDIGADYIFLSNAAYKLTKSLKKD